MRMDRRGFMQTGVALVASATVAKQGLGQTSGQANCFVESGADTVVVNSMAGLENAVNSAPAGRQILIPAGSYTGGTRTFNADGTQANPIVIRPQGARGTVTINNANWRLAAGSARLVFANLYFNNPQVTVNGSHHRFTRCRFRAVSRPIFLLENCTDTRIDHCDLSGWVNSAASKEFFTISNAPVVNGSFRRLLFDYNYIHDISHPTEPATPGFIRTTSTGTWRVNSGVIIDHCLFRNNNVAGQGEFIVVKHSGFKVRFCTFENQTGYLQQRQGGGWEVRSCWFEGMSTTSPLKCWDDWEAGQESGAGRQLVLGNRLMGNLQLWIGAGNTNGIETVDGLPTPGPYHRSRQGQFIGNIVGGGIRLGEMWSNQPNIHPALNNNLWNNTGRVTNVNQQGTTTNNPGAGPGGIYNFTPAEKLAPSQVGLGAPDPLCPSGPQE